MGLIRITERNRDQFIDQILDLEASAEYPLGADTFKIDHGSDYFRFFERLGELRYYGWVEGGKLLAVAAGILRRVPLNGGGLRRSWYLSDLKVHKDFRGKRIPMKMLSRGFLANYLRCQRGYAISMNPDGAKINRVAKLLGRFRWAPLKAETQLALWSLDTDAMRRIHPILERHRGPLRYLSLRGVKDIVLQSTMKALPLLHVQFGPLGDLSGSHQPEAGALHMFCVPETDPLAPELRVLGLEPSSTATVIAHRMRSDWSWILTSDI